MQPLTDEQKETRRIERLKFRYAHALELIRATCAFEHAALPPMLLNGGAAIAFMALFGAIVGKGNNTALNLNLVLAALLCWIVGLVAGTVAIACGYYSQHSFRKARERKVEEEHADAEGDSREAGAKEAEAKFEDRAGWIYRAWAKGLVVLSLVVFVLGIWFAMAALYTVAAKG